MNFFIFSFDELSIYQEFDSGRRSKIAYKLCANNVNELNKTKYSVGPVDSGSTTALITFTSDYSDGLTGFDIQFTIIGEYCKDIRTLSLPGHSLALPHALRAYGVKHSQKK